MVQVRHAKAADLPQIVEIINYYIDNSNALAFEEVEPEWAQKRVEARPFRIAKIVVALVFLQAIEIVARHLDACPDSRLTNEPTREVERPVLRHLHATQRSVAYEEAVDAYV